MNSNTKTNLARGHINGSVTGRGGTSARTRARTSPTSNYILLFSTLVRSGGMGREAERSGASPTQCDTAV